MIRVNYHVEEMTRMERKCGSGGVRVHPLERNKPRVQFIGGIPKLSTTGQCPK